MEYYYPLNEEMRGPFSAEEIVALDIQPETLVWYEGLSDWVLAQEIADIRILLEAREVSTAQGKTASTRSSERPLFWVPAFVMCTFDVILGVFAVSDGVVGVLQGYVMIFGVVLWSRLHYRCWQAMPEEYRFTTPARAVGFFFIPLFNLYWAFVSYTKLSDGYEKWQDARQLKLSDTRRTAAAAAWLFVAGWGLRVVFWLPLGENFVPLHDLLTIASIIVFAVFYSRICNIANALLGITS